MRVLLTVLVATLGIALVLMARGESGQGQAGEHSAVAPMVARDGVPATPAGMTFCAVTRVVDADTIDVANCATPGRVRLILVDSPEVFGGAECLGHEASAYVSAALLGRDVGLEKDVRETDSFDRMLRYVWVDGILFNEQLVRDGYATLATYPPDVKYEERIRSAQEEAIAAGRGLWAPGVCPE